jgi:hypothetical protein
MTMKLTLIASITLLATLAGGVLVHDRLRTKSLVDDAAPTRTAPTTTAKPAAPAAVSLPPVLGPMPASQEASFVDDAAPKETASIGTATRDVPSPVSPAPVWVPAPSATPEPEPEPTPRMTASQEASLDAWIIKTYLGCWKPAAQPGEANRYVARVRLKFKPDGSLLKPPKLVNPPSDPTQKPQAKSVLQAVRACDPLPMPAEYRSFYEQWKTKTILFDPQVATR